MLTEKDIYTAWRRRFLHTVPSFERSANRQLEKARNVKAATRASVQKKMAARRLIVIGDDALVSMRTPALSNLIFAGKTKSTAFVTNRPLEKNAFTKKLKKTFKVFAVSAETFDDQTQKLVRKIQEVENKFERVIVWTGNLRLPNSKFQKRLNPYNPVYVHLHSNVLRWKWAKLGDWVEWSNNIAYVGVSSLYSLNLLQAGDEKDDDIVEPQVVRDEFLSLIKKISASFGQSKVSKPKSIIHLFDQEGIIQLGKIKNSEVRKFCLERAMNAESAMIPRGNIVLLSSAQRSHIAEEAAHYLRLSGAKSLDFGNNGVIIEEALAFFASLLVSPTRKMPMRNKTMTLWDHVHHAGYTLGFQLWKKWNRSASARRMIRKLWHVHPKNELQAELMLGEMVEVK